MQKPLALVIDDEPDIRELLELTLGRMSIETHAAADLNQARRMLNETRFKPHFDFLGTWDRHFGIFPGCGTVLPFSDVEGQTKADGNSGGGCC